jgi:hypothetical protein
VVDADAVITVSDDDIFGGPVSSITAVGSITLEDLILGDVLELLSPTLALNDDGTVTVTAEGATLHLGSGFTAEVSDGDDADDIAITGSYNLDSDVFTLTADHVVLAAFGVVTASADGVAIGSGQGGSRW